MGWQLARDGYLSPRGRKGTRARVCVRAMAHTCILVDSMVEGLELDLLGYRNHALQSRLYPEGQVTTKFWKLERNLMRSSKNPLPSPTQRFVHSTPLA